MPDPPIEAVVEQAVLAERLGFDYVWLYDSHLLFLDPYPLLGLLARETKRVLLGTCVTNPVTRDPTVTASAAATVNLLSRGRAVVGLGMGDSACKVLGVPVASVERTERAARLIRELASGRPAEWLDRRYELAWASGEVPLFLAGLGPRMNELAGRIADGVVIPVAEPSIVRWVVGQVREAAERVGRDPAGIVIAAGTPSFVCDDLAVACEKVRFYPSMVANSAVAMIARYGEAALPSALVHLVRERTAYDYRDHARSCAAHAAYVPDEICESFCIVGSTSRVRERLAELEEIGVDLWNLYLMTGSERVMLEAYGADIVPHLAEARLR